jgi:hypothetical protein
MGKHEVEYVRVERDNYPTPPWCVRALAEFVVLEGRTIWECAAGDGAMVRALEAQGARVYASDIEPRPELAETFDFLAPGLPAGLGRVDGIITNPPWGSGNRLAVEFVKAGLARITAHGGFLALLLPADFDSAVTRLALFQHPYFLARIALTDRPAWFARPDGRRPQPKENCVWHVWSRPLLRSPPPPVVRHAVARAKEAPR